MKAALLAAVVLAVAGIIGVRAGGPMNYGQPGAQKPAHPALSASTLSMPLYFEPNQGQTDPQVKFLARGAGYGLFFTAKEAVLDLERRTTKDQPASGSVIRMRLEGASSTADIRATQPLPGKSNYFIGNNPAKWHRNIPQFGRVEYRGVYPGIDLVYYGNARQLEYDFRVAPGSDPSQIALSFQGASARIDSGDLILATAGGDVRFHAPHIYQASESQQSSAGRQADIPGSFRLLAADKIGFTIGPYDRSRELVIDPVLNYSSYLGGTGTQSLVKVAVDKANYIYLAGSTTSANFPTTAGAYQTALGGASAKNAFIAVFETSITSTAQLVYATYLGGSGIDNLAGVAVDPNSSFPNANIYVAGTTTSANFPAVNAFQATATFNASETHGFVSRLAPSQTGTAQLVYSTYLAGTNAAGTSSDIVTGLAVDANQNAYVTGTTTSTNDQSNGFPSNSNGYQVCPFAPPQTGVGCVVTSGPPQFFASKIDTGLSGTSSMIYSTYFGGSTGTTATGGGVAVDASGYMYFTGTTNMPNPLAVGGPPNFPIYNAIQPCLNQPGATTCSASPTNPNDTDAILVKLNPSQGEPGLAPFYSTYLGGSLNDAGIAVAIDSSDDAFVTGSTNSSDWSCALGSCNQAPNPPFGYSDSNTTVAFIAEIGNQTQSSAIFPLAYFAWLGGSTPDGDPTIGQAIAIDSVGMVHVAGQTFSPNLPYNYAFNSGSSTNYIQTYQGAGDAFVALVDPSAIVTAGDYVTYLGGTAADQATGIAVDSSNDTYVAGTTVSQPSTPCAPPNCTYPITGFPITTTAYQPQLAGSNPNAFVTVLGNSSDIVVSVESGSPNPSPVDAGLSANFTFNVTNNGPNQATSIFFNAIVPTNFSIPPTASVKRGIGSCDNSFQPGQTSIPCHITNLAAGEFAQVQVVVTPTVPLPGPAPYAFSVSCNFSVNGGAFNNCGVSQQDTAVDFTIDGSPSTLTVQNGGLATFTITLTPDPTYNGTVTLTEISSPALVTSNSGLNLWGNQTSTITLDGQGQQQTTLNLQTVARPVNTGSLFRRMPFYATWLPIGGLSLVGLGIGAGSKRRRWLAGALLGLVAGLILLQPACSSSSSNVSTNPGTAAGTYTITVTGSSSTNASHPKILTLNVT